MDIKEIQKKVAQISDIYEKRIGVNRDDDWYVLKLQEELGEFIQSYLSSTGRGKKRGKSKSEIKADVEKELADLFAHVLLVAHHNKIDIEKALDTNWFKYLQK